jgi:hypothetical protein
MKAWGSDKETIIACSNENFSVFARRDLGRPNVKKK